MAGTRNLASYTDNDGRFVTFGLDYDDTLNGVTFFCENDSMQTAFGTLYAVDVSGVRSATAIYGGEFPGKADEGDEPKRTIMVIDQTPVNKRIPLRTSPVNPNKLAGCELESQFPFSG